MPDLESHPAFQRPSPLAVEFCSPKLNSPLSCPDETDAPSLVGIDRTAHRPARIRRLRGGCESTIRPDSVEAGKISTIRWLVRTRGGSACLNILAYQAPTRHSFPGRVTTFRSLIATPRITSSCSTIGPGAVLPGTPGSSFASRLMPSSFSCGHSTSNLNRPAGLMSAAGWAVFLLSGKSGFRTRSDAMSRFEC